MADEELVRILKQGPEAWNNWTLRRAPHFYSIGKQPEGAADCRLDLSRADLSGVNLRGAILQNTNLRGSILNRTNLSQANLCGAILSGGRLSGANLRMADLSQADLQEADLSQADLRRADLSQADLRRTNLQEVSLREADLHLATLREANLQKAYLSSANFSMADLSGADLSGANLQRANLQETYLDSTDLSATTLYGTSFLGLDLSCCKGLETCYHEGPSFIDTRTLQASGRLPLAFLRGIGLSDKLIEFLPSLVAESIQFYSCFISYSSVNEDFVRRLHADFQDKGVRCWFAPEDMKIGAKILDTLDEAIRLRDKLLLVLSEASIASDWVEDEVTKAFAEERRRGMAVLFPVRVDDAVFATNEAWAVKLRDNRNIGDFRRWKDHDAYQKTLDRLLRDLRIGIT